MEAEGRAGQERRERGEERVAGRAEVEFIGR